MKLRRTLIAVATVVGLGAIGLRAFVFDGQPGWETFLLVVQGVAMGALWVLWRRSRSSGPRRGVDMKAKRLHW